MGNTQASQQSQEDFIQTTTSDDLTSRVSEKEAAVVLSDYPPSEMCEPIFRRGDWLRLLSDEGYWWKVYSVQTHKENYIPRCYAAKVYHGWLFEGVARQKAEELLWLPGNRVGSFLIRESTGGTYSLSVRHRAILHYRIFRMPNNWYFISPRLTFQCLEDLVNHYSDIADGLCCVLTGPCLAASGLTQSQPSQAALRRPHRFTWTAMDSADLMQRNAKGLPAGTGCSVSFGVQESVSSYLSVAGVEVTRKRSWKRKKWTSVRTHPVQKLSSMVMEEETYAEVL
ncbi:src-like-adapter [Electrophorus electricus]|uniref:Src like adaptor n=1 Tax=Electrophorus electricus TaxID=8005 RepID=A0A4W4GIF3_ELEEL|nr:src-like-adapter [Electrophorus electricus]